MRAPDIMRKPTVIAMRCLAVIAALFAAGGILATWVIWSIAQESLATIHEDFAGAYYISPFLLHGVVLVILIHGVFVCGLGFCACRLFKKDERGVDLLYGILKAELIWLCLTMMLWGVTGSTPVSVDGICLASAIFLPQTALGFPVAGLAIIWLLRHLKVFNAVAVQTNRWLSAWVLIAVAAVTVVAGGALRRQFRHEILFGCIDGPNMATPDGYVSRRAFERCNLDYDSMMLFGPLSRDDPEFALSYCNKMAMTGENQKSAKALLLLALRFSTIVDGVENGHHNVLFGFASTGPILLVEQLGLSPIIQLFGFVRPYRIPKGTGRSVMLKPMTVADLDAEFNDFMKLNLPPLTQVMSQLDLDALEDRAQTVFEACGRDYVGHATAFERGLAELREAIGRYAGSDGPRYTPIFLAKAELLRAAEAAGLGIASLTSDRWGGSIQAVLTDHKDLIISWPGMGQGTEEGGAELKSRLKSVHAALASDRGQRCSSLDARTQEIILLLPGE